MFMSSYGSQYTESCYPDSPIGAVFISRNIIHSWDVSNIHRKFIPQERDPRVPTEAVMEDPEPERSILFS